MACAPSTTCTPSSPSSRRARAASPVSASRIGSDFKSCAPGEAVSPLDQALGTGDGHATVFQLAKAYPSGPSSWTRTIAKPVAGTVRIAVAGVERTSGFSVDTTTGLVTFTAAPTGALTAGFAFDVPVRFDTDQLSINLSSFAAGEIPSIPLVEIRI